MGDEKDLALKDTLQNIAKEKDYENYKLEITPIDTGGANFSSRLYAGKITAPTKPDLEWFGKVAIINEEYRTEMPVQVYHLEQYAYAMLMRRFDKLESKFKVPEEYRLKRPKLYGYSAVSPHEVIVIEDLSAKGYGSQDRLQPIQWPLASAAVQQLAIMQALSLGVQHYYPEEYDELFQTIKGNGVNESLAKTIIVTTENNLSLINEKYRERVRKYLENMAETAPKLRSPCNRAVLAHGDFKTSNIMHKVDETGKTSAVIIDYQTLHIGSAINDLLYFIFSGSDAEFRRRHFRALLDHYYEQLSLALSRLGLEPEEKYPREDYDDEIKKYLKNGLVLAMLSLPMMCAEAGEAPALDDDLQLQKIMDVKPSQLCLQRLQEVVEDFVQWGEL